MRLIKAFSLSLLLSLPLWAEKTLDVQWKPFSAGLKGATAANKYVFVDVYTDWCTYCKKLDATTLRTSSVVSELEKNFVSVKLNAESQEDVVWKGQRMSARDLAATWGVEGFPTLIFLNPKGEMIGVFASFAEEDLMVKLLTYISSGARERKVSFDEFLKTPKVKS